MANTNLIDLRSDTVTRPTQAMRRAMANAEVGDDVIDIDPTIDRLERVTAQRLGKESAIFMPSGTMTNQVAVRVHCQPGDELLCEEASHIFNKQQGGFAQLSGIVARPIVGNRGALERRDLQDKMRPVNDLHVLTRLLCLENTHNRAGGSVYPWEALKDATEWARENSLRLHLDGARLFNAEVATGIAAAKWAECFDTVSVCYSKGLGAPVGSALAGTHEMIEKARRHRKLFGGGMRQAGIIAAGALYALEHHVARLADDHENAGRLAEAIRSTPGLSLVDQPVETNIVIFSMDDRNVNSSELLSELRQRGVLMAAMSPREIRAVTHLDVDEAQVGQAADILRDVYRELCAVSQTTS